MTPTPVVSDGTADPEITIVTSTPRSSLNEPGECYESPVRSYERRKELREARKKTARRLNITDEGAICVPEEPNAKTEAKWRARLMYLLRYIDDGFGLLRLTLRTA